MRNLLAAATLGVLALTGSSASAPTQNNTITGPSSAAPGSTQEFSLCPRVFPYVWHWRASGDARVLSESTANNCYKCQVQFGRQPATITFEQSNPAGVPPVFNLTKMVRVDTPKKGK